MVNLTARSLPASLAEEKRARDAASRLTGERVNGRLGLAFDAERIPMPGSQAASPMRTWFLVLLALLIGAGAVLTAQRLELTGQKAVPAMPAPQISLAPVGIGALGRVEPASRIRRLGPPSTLAVTRVHKLFVQEGEQVHSGQLLAAFADADLKDAAVAEAGAKAAEAAAALALVQAGGRPSEIAAQEARIDSLAAQQAITARDAARSASLVPSGAAARAVADRDYAVAEQAAANLRQAMEQLATLKQPRPEDVTLAEARQQAAEAALVTARMGAALSRVYAPVAGEILKIYTRPGDLVGPDGLLEIADLDNLEVVADVYQTDLPRVRNGAVAEVTVPGDPQRYGARVVQIGSLVAHAIQAGTDPVARVDGRTAEVRLALLADGAKALRGRIDMQVQVAIRP